jgi:hypothetical protein
MEEQEGREKRGGGVREGEELRALPNSPSWWLLHLPAIACYLLTVVSVTVPSAQF